MNKTVAVFLDDNGKKVSKEEATKVNIIEFDQNGNRLNETYMVRDTNKKDRTFDDIEVDPNSDIIKSEVLYKPDYSIPIGEDSPKVL